MQSRNELSRRSALGAAVVACLGALWSAPAFAAFDHTHADWTALLQKNVVVAADGHSSTVKYAAFKQQQGALELYLQRLSAVSKAEYDGWSKPQRLAFLINTYNAFTIDLILTKYPDLDSIKDLGGLFGSPWKKDFFNLLGKRQSLDGIEHGLIRAPGAFNEPRIHFAVNCASIGCPMLGSEAFVPEQLEAQLADATRRFLSDHSRNRYEAQSNRLAVSRLFDWYGKDFEQGWQGIDSLKGFFASHAKELATAPTAEQAVRGGNWQLDFLDYDWALNDARQQR